VVVIAVGDDHVGELLDSVVGPAVRDHRLQEVQPISGLHQFAVFIG